MKTAVSIPDDIFAEAERQARKLGISRSKLYALALAEFLRRRRGAAITAELNASHSESPEEVDPFVQALAVGTLKREEWEE